MTGGRLKRVAATSIRTRVLHDLWRWRGRCRHRRADRVPPAHGRLATVTAVAPPGRYGALELQGDRVAALQREAARRQRH